MRLAGRFTTLLLCFGVLATDLGGCAQLNSLTSGGDLTIDPGDPCAAQRSTFNGSRTYFTREIVLRTAGGAVLGAAAGAAIGGLANGGRGAAAGAIAGALSGAALGLASGYLDKLHQANLDQATLARQVNQDVTSESQQIDHTAATFSSVRACRFAQAQAIKSELRRGMISRADAETRLDQQRRYFDQEVASARDAGVNMKSRGDQFATAADTLPKPRRRTDPAARATVLATETIPQKRNSFESSVGNAETQSKMAFNLDNSATTAWNDLLGLPHYA